MVRILRLELVLVVTSGEDIWGGVNVLRSGRTLANYARPGLAH